MEEHRGQTKGGLNDSPIHPRSQPRTRTIIRFPKARPGETPSAVGEKPPQTRRNSSPRPRKSPIQTPNPNKSTPTRPRAAPEDRLLPPHGVCGTILPHPLYHLLYFVVHVR